jgi:hypothetical protein
MKSVTIFKNPMTGTIPTELVAHLLSLESIVMWGSQLTGTIPSTRSSSATETPLHQLQSVDRNNPN